MLEVKLKVRFTYWLKFLFLTLIALVNFSYAAVHITGPAKQEVFFRAGEKAVLYWNYTVDDRRDLQFIAFKWMVAVPPYSTTKKTIWQEFNDGTRQTGFDIPSFLRNRARLIGRATLEITNVNKNDSSTYFFEALTNSVGTLSSAINLTVTEPVKKPISDPKTDLTANKTVTICPGSGVGDKCPDNPTHECKRDNDCPRDKTCCLNYCSLKCVENALWPDKTDCPNRAPQVPREICLSANKTCHKDSDCTGKQKCCEDMCNRHCSDTFSLTYAKRVCPVLGVAFACPLEFELKHKCKLHKDCPGSKICCMDYCVLTCVDPDIIRVQKNSNEVPVIKGKYFLVNKFTHGTLKLTCVVTAKSKFEVSWYDSKASLHPDLVHVKYQSRDERKIVSQLRIPNVKCENSGQYICMARTDRTYAELNFHVTVYDRRKGYMCPQSGV